MPRPAASVAPAEGADTAAAAAVAAAAARSTAVAGGAAWLFSAEGARERGGDLKTAMPKAGTAALPEDSKHRLLTNLSGKGVDGNSSAAVAHFQSRQKYTAHGLPANMTDVPSYPNCT